MCTREAESLEETVRGAQREVGSRQKALIMLSQKAWPASLLIENRKWLVQFFTK